MRCRKWEMFGRICRAMHVRGSFTAGEIVILASARRDYAQRTIRKLNAEGGIEFVCRQTDREGRSENVFRVRHRDEFFLKYVLPFERRGEATSGSGLHQN